MTLKMKVCQHTLTKKMHYDTHSLTNSHILLTQTHGCEACDAEVFRESRARQGPGW